MPTDFLAIGDTIPYVVVTTTCVVPSDDKVGIVTTLGFQRDQYSKKHITMHAHHIIDSDQVITNIKSKRRWETHWFICKHYIYIFTAMIRHGSGPVFTKRTDILSQDLVWSLETTRFVFTRFQSLWNLTDTSAAALQRRLSNFKAIWKVLPRISRLRDFPRHCGKTCYRL